MLNILDEEVGGPDGFEVSAQEPFPSGVTPPLGSWWNAIAAKDVTHGVGAEFHAKIGQGIGNGSVSPSGIFLGHAEDQVDCFGRSGWASAPMRYRQCSLTFPRPAQEGFQFDDHQIVFEVRAKFHAEVIQPHPFGIRKADSFAGGPKLVPVNEALCQEKIDRVMMDFVKG